MMSGFKKSTDIQLDDKMSRIEVLEMLGEKAQQSEIRTIHEGVSVLGEHIKRIDEALNEHRLTQEAM